MPDDNKKIDIKSMTFEELVALLGEFGYPPYRAEQIFIWLSKGCGAFAEMMNVPKALQLQLSERCHLSAPTLLTRQESHADGTLKYLWELHDGNTIETVVMRYQHGNSVCISTQVGCRQNCAFCASAIGGLIRNLEPSEMLDEVLYSENTDGLHLSNVVLMGIGEPLDNLENVLRFLEILSHPKGRNLGLRHVTLSTCGLTEILGALADRKLQLTLSVSLHAPDDETRSRLMPSNRGRGVEALFQASEDYFRRTGRRVTFEYAMIDGVNDSPAQAQLLADRVRPLRAHVNLIPLNVVKERDFRPSSSKNMLQFKQILEKNGINVTVRRKLGADVDASCGQLRRKIMGEIN